MAHQFPFELVSGMRLARCASHLACDAASAVGDNVSNRTTLAESVVRRATAVSGGVLRAGSAVPHKELEPIRESAWDFHKVIEVH